MSNWEPAPEGPPADPRRKHSAIRQWCEEHPGEWAVIRKGASGTDKRWRDLGYEVTTRATGDGNKRDIYLRLIPKDE